MRIQNILGGLKLRNQVGMSGFGLIFDKPRYFITKSYKYNIALKQSLFTTLSAVT